MEAKIGSISTKNLGDTAYERIAEAVSTGVFRPGERITIRGLSESFSVSSTPVRDAIKRLVLEGVLEQKGAKLVQVPMISPDTYMEIAGLRVTLEGIAAREAALNANPTQIAELEGTISRNEAAILANDWPLATKLNKEFHFALAKIAAKPVLLEVLETLWLRVGPAIALHYDQGGRSMIDQHYVVLNAIKKNDSKAAANAIGMDIEAVRDDIVETVKQLRDSLDRQP